MPVEGKERMVLPGAQSQYRLKPADEYESQVCINEEFLNLAESFKFVFDKYLRRGET